MLFMFCAHLLCADAAKDPVYNDIPAYGARYLSPEAIAYAGGGAMLVAARTGDELLVLENSKLVKTIPLEGHPSGIAAAKGGICYVTIAAPFGKLAVIDYAGGKVLKSYRAGHMPRAPLLSADGASLYILNQFSADVLRLKPDTGEVLARGKAVREPYSCVLSKDQKKLYVLNQLPAAKGGLYEENIGACVSVLDAQTLAPISKIDLPNGAINATQIILSPDGLYLYATHVIARFNVPTSQVERGWVNTNAVSVIDAKEDKLIASVLLDDIDLGSANPYGLAISPCGKSLCVAQAGTHEISVIDRVALHEKIRKTLNHENADRRSPTPEDPANDLSFLSGIRVRHPAGGLGPRYIAFDSDGNLFVTLYYTDAVSKLEPAKNYAFTLIDIGGNPEMTQVRKGDLYFHDGSFCFQKWLSCATCHTEVRTDALNWDLLNDGIGNPKQSKSLLFAHYTPPSMITGVRKDAETGVRKGMMFIQFVDRPDEDAQAIDAYLKSLKSLDSPYLNPDGSMSEAAERGMIIFEMAKCNVCHYGEFYTDMQMHDVGSGLDEYEGQKFDTPSLREIWRTAPYLYDGRARTVFEMLKNFNKDNKHGHTSDLSDEDLKDLEAYILTL